MKEKKLAAIRILFGIIIGVKQKHFNEVYHLKRKPYFEFITRLFYSYGNLRNRIIHKK